MQPDTPPGARLTPTIVVENLQTCQHTASLKAAIEFGRVPRRWPRPGDGASIVRHAEASEGTHQPGGASPTTTASKIEGFK